MTLITRGPLARAASLWPVSPRRFPTWTRSCLPAQGAKKPEPWVSSSQAEATRRAPQGSKAGTGNRPQHLPAPNKDQMVCQNCTYDPNHRLCSRSAADFLACLALGLRWILRAPHTRDWQLIWALWRLQASEGPGEWKLSASSQALHRGSLSPFPYQVSGPPCIQDPCSWTCI